MSFSIQDKLSIAQKLDGLGVRYIEGGWPGSNPKDIEFFRAARQLRLENAEVTAFGSTRRKNTAPERDDTLNALLGIDIKTAVLFGKSWMLHVTDVLKTSPEENLSMVADSIEYLRGHGLGVIFDAEHFFDGFKADGEYALSVAKTAEEAGAEVIVLCDTNGGTLTQDVHAIVEEAQGRLHTPLGIHAHNDCGLAAANTVAAVGAGVIHVQGTINGLGERCGNADLCEVLPILHFKMGMKVLRGGKPLKEQFRGLTALSRYVYQLLNMPADPQQPFVGKGAFTHKAGVHVDAVLKQPRAYEHIDPSLVGNTRGLVISELAGRAGVIREASELGLTLTKKQVEAVLDTVKRLEAEGYQFENAKASVHLLVMKELGLPTEPFGVKYWRASALGQGSTESMGEVLVSVSGEAYYETARGVGPVHALDLALKKALLRCFPELGGVELVNYKVTVVDSVKGTASAVRVFIEFRDEARRWATTSVSSNILEASAKALIEGYTYRLVLPEARTNRARNLVA